MSGIISPDGKSVTAKEPTIYKIHEIEFPFVADNPKELFQSCTVPQYMGVQAPGGEQFFAVGGFVQGWNQAESLIIIEVCRALERRDEQIAQLEATIEGLKSDVKLLQKALNA